MGPTTSAPKTGSPTTISPTNRVTTLSPTIEVTSTPTFSPSFSPSSLLTSSPTICPISIKIDCNVQNGPQCSDIINTNTNCEQMFDYQFEVCNLESKRIKLWTM